MLWNGPYADLLLEYDSLFLNLMLLYLYAVCFFQTALCSDPTINFGNKGKQLLNNLTT